ncbi:MAG TPA: potassium channel family protein [Solirubrobacteraceae bacterium]|nr:potassium channel family protein [Solirubrobacteraceae bacterium]
MSQGAEVHGAGGFRYGGVLLLTLAFAVFALIASDSGGVRTIELFVAGATLLVAVLTSRAPAATRRLAGAGVGMVVLAGGITAAFVGPHPALTFAGTTVLLAVTAGVILAGLVRLVVERGVVLQAVFGALAVYMLVGLVFAFTIGTLATGQSTPYFASGTDATQNARVYFSFTALTTTGFGDYTAATRAGRALAVLEMLVGQLYLVTVIATLVGNLRHQRQ